MSSPIDKSFLNALKIAILYDFLQFTRYVYQQLHLDQQQQLNLEDLLQEEKDIYMTLDTKLNSHTERWGYSILSS